jgi:hypothetical protein
MLPVFTFPLAFLGLLAIPALIAIYVLRNRFRRQPVSSLMLWLDPREAREGGTRIKRLHTPLLFVLELLAILFLVLAAADPHIRTRQGARPLVVVLDDSFSMQAGGADSPRARALQALRQEFERRPPYSIRFILAGQRPQALGEPVRTAREALALLDGWHCRAPASSLNEAITLAAEVGGDLATLLVVTDSPPPDQMIPDKGPLQWWAFGESRGNLAFVNAARTTRDGAERCLLEVANLSRESRTTALVVETLTRSVSEGTPTRSVSEGQVLQRSTLSLGAEETRRIVLQLRPNTGPIRARLDDDDLTVDNEVTLQPTLTRAVRVDLHIGEKALHQLFDRAVRSVREATFNAFQPDLVFTDQLDRQPKGPHTWMVYLIADKGAEAYTGPFILDRTHPLTEGLSLRGVIWGAARKNPLAGAPVIMAGNIPLLTDSEILPGGAAANPSFPGGTPGARHELRWRIQPDISTLQDSPDWPILICNLLHWRASMMPGLSRTNLRLGEEVTLNLPEARETVEVVAPNGVKRTQSVGGRQLILKAEEVGVYKVHAGEETFAFASNALNREESDLRGCGSGRWGDWLDDTSLRLEYGSIAPVLLLLFLAVVTVHMILIARHRRVGL